MTLQETFDMIVKHLAQQGRRSELTGGFAYGCAYRGPDNMKCAVGCLIPDELYDWSLERMSVCAIYANPQQTTFNKVIDYLNTLIGADQNTICAFLERMQVAHDTSHTPEELKRALKQICTNFKLDDAIVDTITSWET